MRVRIKSNLYIYLYILVHTYVVTSACGPLILILSSCFCFTRKDQTVHHVLNIIINSFFLIISFLSLSENPAMYETHILVQGWFPLLLSFQVHMYQIFCLQPVPENHLKWKCLQGILVRLVCLGQDKHFECKCVWLISPYVKIVKRKASVFHSEVGRHRSLPNLSCLLYFKGFALGEGGLHTTPYNKRLACTLQKKLGD